jgi:hypothetical protein
MKKIFTILVLMFSYNLVFALSAYLNSVDIEYDYSSDDIFVLCDYSFSWKTESNTMTGFSYLFPEDTIFDISNSFAIINQARKVEIKITKIDQFYSIDLPNKMRYSGTCDYNIKCKIPKTSPMLVKIMINEFDYSIKDLIITAIIGRPIDGNVEEVNVFPNAYYDEVQIDKNGNLLNAIRIEIIDMRPNTTASLEVRKRVF